MSAAALAIVLALASAQTPEPEPTPPPEPPKEEVVPEQKPFRSAPPSGSFYLKKPKPSDRLGRIGVELSASMVGELGGGLVGAFAGCLAVAYGPQGCLIAFLVGALIGGLVGVPTGVLIGGYLMDGNGSVPATIAGALAGIGLSAALIGVVTYNLQGNSALAVLSGIGFVLMPNLFSILAFELTSDISRSYTEATTPPTMTVVPTLGKDSAGLALALSF